LGRVEDFATNIGDKMNETRGTLVDTVRNNPVPAAIMGVGLAWLLMNRSKSSKERGGGSAGAGASAKGGQLLETAKHAVSDAGSAVSGATRQVSDATGRRLQQVADAAGNAVHGVADATASIAHGASDAASRLADQASDAAASVAEGVKRVEAGFQTQLKENPLALGAAALAIGAVVGFSLPSTLREDALMGETRDRLLEQAGGAAHDAVTLASHLADQALEGIKNSASDSSLGASA
jgi:hypothetical protein